jgi:hypothetical protein
LIGLNWLRYCNMKRRSMSQLGQTEKSGRTALRSASPPSTDVVRPVNVVRFVPILLQKSVEIGLEA